jgi:hypothetical protein
MERQKVSAREWKLTKERKEKKKENNKNDILSICDLFMYTYLFYLKFIHSLFKDASSSWEYTESNERLVAEELMTREKHAKECRHILIWDTIPEFNLTGWEILWKITIR